jgi:hypothetical protein
VPANRFTGPLPSLPSLTQLQDIDVSMNALEGPVEFLTLPLLLDVNLRFNR